MSRVVLRSGVRVLCAGILLFVGCGGGEGGDGPAKIPATDSPSVNPSAETTGATASPSATDVMAPQFESLDWVGATEGYQVLAAQIERNGVPPDCPYDRADQIAQANGFPTDQLALLGGVRRSTNTHYIVCQYAASASGFEVFEISVEAGSGFLDNYRQEAIHRGSLGETAVDGGVTQYTWADSYGCGSALLRSVDHVVASIFIGGEFRPEERDACLANASEIINRELPVILGNLTVQRE